MGRRIRSFRLDRNYSQERLAGRAGISRDSVIYAENGTKAISVDIVHRLADALAVPPAWLFSDSLCPPDARESGPDVRGGVQGG